MIKTNFFNTPEQISFIVTNSKSNDSLDPNILIGNLDIVDMTTKVNMELEQSYLMLDLNSVFQAQPFLLGLSLAC